MSLFRPSKVSWFKAMYISTGMVQNNLLSSVFELQSELSWRLLPFDVWCGNDINVIRVRRELLLHSGPPNNLHRKVQLNSSSVVQCGDLRVMPAFSQVIMARVAFSLCCTNLWQIELHFWVACCLFYAIQSSLTWAHKDWSWFYSTLCQESGAHVDFYTGTFLRSLVQVS